ncbi:MAG: CAP domain-containing protein [Nocardioides sp.]|uniref:CAP domain-containing protein n=1 Tax=Nocardioides sp. TaxID=35761 RepID=UPI003D6B4392
MHRPVSCVLALLLAASALLVSAGPASAGEGGTIKQLANAARADAGLEPLARDSALDKLARRWAHKMAADGSLSHNPDLAEQVPEGWRGIGENVAQGYTTGAEMHEGWMGSEGHRANILGDYTHIGIAFVVVDGGSWGVQVFAKYPPGVRPAVKPKAASPEPEPESTPEANPTKAAAPPPSAKPTPSPTAAPTPSRTPSASASPTQSASPSESAEPAWPEGDSESAAPVTYDSGSPVAASSGLFGLGIVEVAAGVLGLSALALLVAFLLVRRRRARLREALRREGLRRHRPGPIRYRPAGAPYGGTRYGQVYPGDRYEW